MNALRLIALAAILSAASCRALPEREPEPPPVDLPDAWAAAAAATEPGVKETWWEDFGDERLSQMIGEALANNPSMEGAEARIRQSEALAKIAGANLFPALSVGYTGGASKVFTGKSEFAPETAKSQSHGVSLNYRWEIDLWNGIRSGRAAAIADVETARAFYYGIRLSLSAQTAKAYFAVIESERQVEVAKANLESAEDLLARIRDRFGEGLREALDLKLAESEVSGAKASLAARERVLDASRRQLETLVARYPAGEAVTADKLPAAPPPVPPGIPADILARRPDLVAAERRLVAADFRVREAEAALYPNLTITGSNGASSSDVADLLGGDFSVWSFFANLAQPIVEGDRIRANIRRTEAVEDEVAAEFANSVLDALAEVEIALAADAWLAQQEAALVTAVELAQASVDLAEERFLAGLTDILNVLESRRRLFTARSELLRAQLDRLDTRIDLYVALGGGFTKERMGVAGEEAP